LLMPPVRREEDGAMYSLGLQLDAIRHALACLEDVEAGFWVLAAMIIAWLASHEWSSDLHRRSH